VSHRAVDAFFVQTVGADGASPSQVPMDGTHTIAATTTFAGFTTKQLDAYSVQFSVPVTGAPSGSVAFQISNDHGKGLSADGVADPNLLNWSAVEFWDEATGGFLATKAVAGAASFVFSFRNCTWRWCRLVWTNTSGTILPTITVQQKDYA
jgi:hypothetical protein